MILSGLHSVRDCIKRTTPVFWLEHLAIHVTSF